MPVVILTDIPSPLKNLVENTRNEIARVMGKMRDTHEHYIFDPGIYPLHMTLAYVSDEPLTMAEFTNCMPGLENDLDELAQKTTAIDISESLTTKGLVVFQGTQPRDYEGHTYKNYAVLAIKIKPTVELLNLVTKTKALLTKYPAALTPAPLYNAHVTIGWVYDSRDINASPMVYRLAPILEQMIAHSNTICGEFIIDVYSLAVHDGPQRDFQLLSRTSTREHELKHAAGTQL